MAHFLKKQLKDSYVGDLQVYPRNVLCVIAPQGSLTLQRVRLARFYIKN